MQRTPIRYRQLPNYTHEEEVFHTVSHTTGGVFAVIALVMCTIVSYQHQNPYGLVSSLIYGTSMLLLYTMSSIYHALSPNHLGKRVFQVIDHCSVFLLIAGTYTPYCLVTLRGVSPAIGWAYFTFVWGVTLIGVTLNAIDLGKYKVFSNICYLALGWCILGRIRTMWQVMAPVGFFLLLGGGIAYTIGAVLYMGGKGHKYMHAVFHLFVLLGTLLQFLSILFYVL